jgi:hypothetical protein
MRVQMKNRVTKSNFHLDIQIKQVKINRLVRSEGRATDKKGQTWIFQISKHRRLSPAQMGEKRISDLASSTSDANSNWGLRHPDEGTFQISFPPTSPKPTAPAHTQNDQRLS